MRSQRARQRVATDGYQPGLTAVPVMAWEDRYNKYLGVKTGADHTPDLGRLGTEYISDVEAIMKSELTDWQKVDAIHRFAKPRLVYALQNQSPPTGWAKTIDKRVKALVKSAMKLPRRTIDAFLFSPWRAGGLGLPRLEDEVHIYGISSAYRLLTLSNDPMVLDVSQAALEVTARKRSKGLTSPQDFLNSPPQRGEGKQGDIQSMWSRVRVSATLPDDHQPGREADHNCRNDLWSVQATPELWSHEDCPPGEASDLLDLGKGPRKGSRVCLGT